MNNEQGHSGWFYFWLIVGIVGVIGFFAVAASAGGGM